MGTIVEESLMLRSMQSIDSARQIVARARAKSGLNADDAMAVAVEETRRFRNGK